MWRGLLVVLPLAKGVIMAAVVTALGTTFVQGLIMVIVSALLTGIFLLLATAMTVRATRENRGILHDIKRKVGATQRAEDQESA